MINNKTNLDEPIDDYKKNIDRLLGEENQNKRTLSFDKWLKLIL